MVRKLNVGAGTNPVRGYDNVDKHIGDNALDIFYGDIEEGLDYPDNFFDEILLDNVVEHLDNIPKALREIFRLLKPSGVCRIITPHYSSKSSWIDPTHRYHLSYFSFDYFVKGSRENYLDARFESVQKKLSFPGGLFGLIGRLIFFFSPVIWEGSWSFVFRASTLRFELKK